MRRNNHKERTTNWSRKPNDIPLVSLASLSPSVMVLTLQSWKMSGNSSTLALNQQSLPCQGWGYL